MHLNTTTYDVPAGEEQAARDKMDALGFHSLALSGRISVIYPKDRAQDVLQALSPEREAVASARRAKGKAARDDE